MDAQPDDDSEKLTFFDRLRPYDALQWLSSFTDVYLKAPEDHRRKPVDEWRKTLSPAKRASLRIL